MNEAVSPPRATLGFLLLVITCAHAPVSAAGTHLPRLKVSENKHFLVYEDGRPFFYLGDTAWELFHRLNREYTDRYLANRAAKSFTIIQAVALAEFEGLTATNAYGYRPLLENDPTRPDVRDGPNNDYWDHVDYVVNKAESLGLFVAMLPTWGDKWNKKWGTGPEIFNPTNAATYGEWLGRRYRDKPIIWILGGDRPVENDAHKAIIRAMARGLKRGDGGTHLMTFHPSGGQGSSQWFQDDDWLDFNLRQNGHVAEFNPRYAQTRADYDRTPVKPVIDGEPLYEDHPISFKAADFGHSVAADVRRPLYWDLFGGACGHTYGNHSVWQFWAPGRAPVNNPLLPWTEAIDQPGANQMQFARRLLESRPFLTRIPDDAVIVTSSVPTAVPGAGLKRLVATRDAQGSYAMVYVPAGRAFKVRMDKISGAKVKAWWFNPRDGTATAIGEFPNTGEREFTPPDKGEMLDWVLVLDDAARDFPVPGHATLSANGPDSSSRPLETATTAEADTIYYPPPESQGGWRMLREPDAIRRLGGMDPEKLAELRQWLQESDARKFAAVVIRHGYIVLEEERGISSISNAARIASCSKAICATVLAIASELSQQGLTPRRMTFADPAFQYIPWAQPLSDPRKASITVGQLLNHTSGICPEATGAPNDGTWDYILGHSGDGRTAQLAFDPGTACGYSTHALAHASLVCETVTGKPYDQFAIEALFKPLGIEHWWFQYYEGGSGCGRHPSHGLGMPARDLARVAYCMARGGQWRGRQIIPKWFVDQTAAATHKVQGKEMRFKLDAQSFSHGWELPAVQESAKPAGARGIPADARFKPGSGGQLIAFVPSQDLVVTRQTGSSGDWQYAEYLRRACAAVLPPP